MSLYLAEGSDFASVANSIRSKTGGNLPLIFPGDFVTGVNGIITYEKAFETEVTGENVGTSATQLKNYYSDNTDIFTSDKILYVRIRDKAGARKGYFYGSDKFFTNPNPKNEDTSYSNAAPGAVIRVDEDGKWVVYASSGYGVYAAYVYPNGRVRIYGRSSANTGIVDGTFTVEGFLIDWPGKVSPFDAEIQTPETPEEEEPNNG